jgi:hypothetical protein
MMQVEDFQDGILGEAGRDNENKKPVVNKDDVKSSEEEGQGGCVLGDGLYDDCDEDFDGESIN